MEQLVVMMLTNLPNFAGFIILAYSNFRVIDRLFAQENHHAIRFEVLLQKLLNLEASVISLEHSIAALQDAVYDVRDSTKPPAL